MEKLREALIQHGAPVVPVLEEALTKGSRAQQALKECKDIAWEKIHSGHWKDVPLVWRQLYALCCLEQGAHTLKATADPRRLKVALRDLDLALMMGAPDYTAQINDLIGQYERVLGAGPPASVSSSTAAPATDSAVTPPDMMIEATERGAPALSHPLPRVFRPDLMSFASQYMEKQQPVVLTVRRSLCHAVIAGKGGTKARRPRQK